MALVVKDRVQETSTTAGTGTLTLSGASPGYQTFSSSIGNSNTTFYTIYDPTALTWEVGIGTVGAGTLARTTVLSNSLGTTALISFAANSKFVFCTYPASQSINYDANNVATIGSTLSYSDTGIIGSFASTVAGYNQVIFQNKSTATNASSNLNVSNDAGTSGANYAEFGINSSTFTGTGSFNIAGASYVASASTDLTLGTYGAYKIHFVTNSSTTDAMTIFNSGGVSLGGYGDPGIGTLYANNVYLGFNGITAAAGTTILTNASAAWQNVTGTTTQTIKLPDATTLYKGLGFTITSSSTGNVTITDNASTTLDTVVTGGTAIMVLTDNSTVAGTWKAYSYIPSSYDFSTTTANFGTATITSAVWNGTTIATGYGGTGLTTFTAANNAIYSTSASALAAGTLPIQAGGTAATTFTANGVIYGNGTSALGVTAAGTTGQVLLATTSGAPTWGSVPSTGAVTSITFGSTGLTPSTATTGAVTVAGTLIGANGGTGQSTYAVGDLLQGAATNTLSKLAAVATGNALISGGVTTASSWGKIGLTTHVSGTLPIANGGTNLTAYTTGDIVYASATNVLSSLADVATGNALISGGVGAAPSYGKIGLTTHVSGTLPIGNGGTGTATSFTTGSVVFAGASGVYTQDNANLFWDDTNNYLGIGTAAPTTKLTISANTALPSVGAITGTNLWQVGADATTNAFTLDAFGGANAVFTRRANGTSASPTALTANSLILQFGARGYGATSYSSTARAAFQFLASENWTDTAQGAYITFSTTANTTATVATERMRILDSGAISFGSSGTAYGTSGQVLTSAGNATPTWTTPTTGTVTAVSVVSANGFTGTVANPTTTPAITLTTSITGILQGNGTAISAASTTGTGSVVLSASPTFTGTVVAPIINAGAATALTLQSASTTALTIDTSQNVGIGTTSPQYKLDAFGAGQFRATTNTTSNAAWYSIGSIQEASAFGVATGIVVEDSGTNKYAMTFGTKPNSATAITERMRIDSTGNVGIGNTPSGTYKLEVTGKTYSSGGFIPRSLAAASATGTVTPNSDAYDQVNYLLTGTVAFAVPSGTPTDGQKLSIRLYAASTQTVSWTTTAGGYRIIGTTLPTSVATGKTVYVGCVYNSTDSFWDVVAVATQA